MTSVPDARRRSRRATYRLQLTPEFGFARVAELIEPLAALGVSHLYLSPIAQAVPTSQHGYDVVDHETVRAEFGGRGELWELLDRVDAAGLAVVVDHVPNHVSVERPDLNPNWWAMLRDGPTSAAARLFDIDWDAAGGTVIVPRLGRTVDEVLADGEITVSDGASGGPEVRIGDLRFPVRPGTENLRLDELLDAQHYRLTWWRSPERNVRRFFTIDDLVAVCVEHDEVRRSVDSLIESLCEHPAFDGVRVDHVDGLAAPGEYLTHLRELIGADRWLLVEKILGPGEQLPASWPVDGTTGYEFVVDAEHVLVDRSGAAHFDPRRQGSASPGSDVDPEPATYHEVEDTARREVLDQGLRPDLDRLLRRVADAVAGDPGTDEVPSPDEMRAAIIELTVRLDRYRTYLPDDPESSDVLDDLVVRTRTEVPDLDAAIATFAGLVRSDDAVRSRWQQLTGPAMAKGAEDRAFFRYLRLAGFNEVGGRPDAWHIDPHEFHRHRLDSLESHPETLLASTTHDTKRSSGVRARSLALSSMGSRFVEVSGRWQASHAEPADRVGGDDLSLALQTAVTAWPIDADRLGRFLVKAAREADLLTSWTDPDDAYESALGRLAAAVSASAAEPGGALGELAADVDRLGRSVEQALTALHLTAPGVPDLYQGAPMGLFSLVDPDNRVPPRWDRWRAVVEAARRDDDGDTAEADDGDLARARAVLRLLDLRARRADAFGPGSGYTPLAAVGPSGDSTVAFVRSDRAGTPTVATVAVAVGSPDDQRSATTLRLPPGRWRRLLGPGDDVDGDTDLSLSMIVGSTLAEVFERSG